MTALAAAGFQPSIESAAPGGKEAPTTRRGGEVAVLCQYLPTVYPEIRRRHFIRATNERLRKRDRPLVPRSRKPLCVCPWGNPKGGTPFGAPSAMCYIDCSKGRTRGTPKEWVPFLCLCASCWFFYPPTWDSTYKSTGGTLSGTTKERLRKRDRPFGPTQPQPAVCLPVGVPKGDSPLWWSFPPFCQQKGGPAGGVGARGI